MTYIGSVCMSLKGLLSMMVRAKTEIRRDDNCEIVSDVSLTDVTLFPGS